MAGTGLEPATRDSQTGACKPQRAIHPGPKQRTRPVRAGLLPARHAGRTILPVTDQSMTAQPG